MKFTSITFGFFFLFVYLIYWQLKGRAKLSFILVASILFYSAWSPFFGIHFFGLALINYLLVGRLLISKSRSLFILILSIDLFNLFFFKYFYLFLDFLFTDFSCYAGRNVRRDGEYIDADSVRQKVR